MLVYHEECSWMSPSSLVSNVNHRQGLDEGTSLCCAVASATQRLCFANLCRKHSGSCKYRNRPIASTNIKTGALTRHTHTIRHSYHCIPFNRYACMCMSTHAGTFQHRETHMHIQAVLCLGCADGLTYTYLSLLSSCFWSKVQGNNNRS